MDLYLIVRILQVLVGVWDNVVLFCCKKEKSRFTSNGQFVVALKNNLRSCRALTAKQPYEKGEKIAIELKFQLEERIEFLVRDSLKNPFYVTISLVITEYTLVEWFHIQLSEHHITQKELPYTITRAAVLLELTKMLQSCPELCTNLRNQSFRAFNSKFSEPTQLTPFFKGTIEIVQALTGLAKHRLDQYRFK